MSAAAPPRRIVLIDNGGVGAEPVIRALRRARAPCRTLAVGDRLAGAAIEALDPRDRVTLDMVRRSDLIVGRLSLREVMAVLDIARLDADVLVPVAAPLDRSLMLYAAAAVVAEQVPPTLDEFLADQPSNPQCRLIAGAPSFEAARAVLTDGPITVPASQWQAFWRLYAPSRQLDQVSFPLGADRVVPALSGVLGDGGIWPAMNPRLANLNRRHDQDILLDSWVRMHWRGHLQQRLEAEEADL